MDSAKPTELADASVEVIVPTLPNPASDDPPATSAGLTDSTTPSQLMGVTSQVALCSMSAENASQLLSLAFTQLQSSPDVLLAAEKNPYLLQKIADDFRSTYEQTASPPATDGFSKAGLKVDLDEVNDIIDVNMATKSLSSYQDVGSDTQYINPGDINAAVKYLASEMQAEQSASHLNYQIPDIVANAQQSLENITHYIESQNAPLESDTSSECLEVTRSLYAVPASKPEPVPPETGSTVITALPKVADLEFTSYAPSYVYPVALYSTSKTTPDSKIEGVVLSDSTPTCSNDTMYTQSSICSVLPSCVPYTYVPSQHELPSTQHGVATKHVLPCSENELPTQHEVSPTVPVQHEISQQGDTPYISQQTQIYEHVPGNLDHSQTQMLDVSVREMPLAQSRTDVGHAVQPVISHSDYTTANVLTAYSTGTGHQSLTGDQNTFDAVGTSVLDIMVQHPTTASTAAVVPAKAQSRSSQCEVIHVVTEKELTELSIIYCVECNKSYSATTSCPEHNVVYNHIPDKPILSRARTTLPDMFYLGSPNNLNSRYGVYTSQEIEAKTLFGPLEGQVWSTDGTKSNSPDIWQVFQSTVPVMLIDTQSEDSANWLKFVCRASSNATQNLVVYQQGLSLYFVTTRPVKQNEQLLYWYSRDYAMQLRLPPHPDDVGRCNECNMKFSDETVLERHKKQKHIPNPNRKFLCPVCQKAFISRTKVDLHMSTHTGARPVKCTICNKGFTDKSNLRKHIKIHQDVREHVCKDCGKTFRQRIHLDTHRLLHTSGKSLQCEFCDKLFTRAPDLKQHLNLHTKAKQYPCPTCQRVFHRKNNMIKHMKIHNPKREKVPCSKCCKDFPDKSHMKRHLKICKGKKPPIPRIRSETGAELGLSIAKKRIQKREMMLRQNSKLNQVPSLS